MYGPCPKVNHFIPHVYFQHIRGRYNSHFENGQYKKVHMEAVNTNKQIKLQKGIFFRTIVKIIKFVMQTLFFFHCLQQFFLMFILISFNFYMHHNSNTIEYCIILYVSSTTILVFFQEKHSENPRGKYHIFFL